MSWHLYRWVWRLEGPLYLGRPPAGSLNRTRLFAPARTLWGAVTAELARSETGGFPDYAEVAERIKDQARFTYLFPAQRVGKEWRAWLPQFEEGKGLVWRREDSKGGGLPDRHFRRQLLQARAGTAIEPDADAAAEGTLRETECIQPHWAGGNAGIEAGERVFLIGFVFVQADSDLVDQLDALGGLFLGGDTRYGFGHVRKMAFEPGDSGVVFGMSPSLAGHQPGVRGEYLLGHAEDPEEGESTIGIGAKELLAGWQRQAEGATLRAEENGGLLWAPGSRLSDTKWLLDREGIWHSSRG